MPAITYADFSGGLDRRLRINVQEANKLWVLRNAFTTQGKRIQKRPALRLMSSSLTGTVGLRYLDGRLTVFVQPGSVYSVPGSVNAVILTDPLGFGVTTLRSIDYAEGFNGFPYVVGRYTSNISSEQVTQHHYVDGTPDTRVTDANCPQGEVGGVSVTKAASRLYCAAGGTFGEVVRYCAAGDPRDWTTASDAGFLPTGIQQDSTERAIAVGTFQDALVVGFVEGAQIWNVAVDPSANSLRKRLFGTGTLAPYSLASFSNDLAFLAPFGFRSMRAAETSDRIDDWDIGVAIDSLVIPDIEAIDLANNSDKVFGLWIPQLGQYWALFNMGTYSKAWVYTYSRVSKIACWSEYTFPEVLTAMTTGNGKVYFRSADNLYSLDATAYTDDGELIDVEVQLAFQDAKQPGVAKQFYGADYVVEGSPTVAFKYDPRDTDKEGVPMTIPGDTRPGDVCPVEICSAAIGPVFRHSADEAFSLDALTLYYNELGIQV